MSYVERIFSGRFSVIKRNKKRKVRGSWHAFPGWGLDVNTPFGGQGLEQEMITGFFKINSLRRLKIFLDDGDGLFGSGKDDLLATYKLTRRERRSFNRYEAGDFDIDYINWHVPPELCTQTECYGSFYRTCMSPEMSNICISADIDLQKGESLRETAFA